MLFFSCSEIFCRYVDDTVCINIESNFDLRDSTRSRRDSVKSELSEWFIIFCELSFSLYDIDIYRCLVVCRCREYLAFLCRDRCISLDQSCGNSAHCFDRKRKRCNIKKKDISCSCVSCKFSSLNRSSKSNTFIRIQRFARFFSCQSLYFFLYCRNTCRSAYKQYLTEICRCKSRIGKSASYRLCRSVYEISCQLIEFCSCQIHIKVFRSFGSCRNERKVDICCCCGRKFFFCFLCRFF